MRFSLKIAILLLVSLSFAVSALSDSPSKLRGPKGLDYGLEGTKYGPITPRDTMWRLGNKFRHQSEVSVYQVMVAILKKNPDAFEHENLNGLRMGSILFVPSHDEVLEIDRMYAKQRADADDKLWDAIKRGTLTPEQKSAVLGPLEDAKQQDVSEAKEELAIKIDAVQEEQTEKLNAIQTQFTHSIETVETVLEENQTLQDKLGVISEELNVLKLQLGEESEIQKQMALIIEQQQQLLMQQKEDLAIVKAMSEEMTVGDHIAEFASSTLGMIVFSTIPALLALLFMWSYFRKKNAPEPQEEFSLPPMPDTKAMMDPVPAAAGVTDFNDPLSNLDSSLDDFQMDDGLGGLGDLDNAIQLDDDDNLDLNESSFDDDELLSDDLLGDDLLDDGHELLSDETEVTDEISIEVEPESNDEVISADDLDALLDESAEDLIPEAADNNDVLSADDIEELLDQDDAAPVDELDEDVELDTGVDDVDNIMEELGLNEELDEGSDDLSTDDDLTMDADSSSIDDVAEELGLAGPEDEIEGLEISAELEQEDLAPDIDALAEEILANEADLEASEMPTSLDPGTDDIDELLNSVADDDETIEADLDIDAIVDEAASSEEPEADLNIDELLEQSVDEPDELELPESSDVDTEAAEYDADDLINQDELNVDAALEEEEPSSSDDESASIDDLLDASQPDTETDSVDDLLESEQTSEVNELDAIDDLSESESEQAAEANELDAIDDLSESEQVSEANELDAIDDLSESEQVSEANELDAIDDLLESEQASEVNELDNIDDLLESEELSDAADDLLDAEQSEESSELESIDELSELEGTVEESEASDQLLETEEHEQVAESSSSIDDLLAESDIEVEELETDLVEADLSVEETVQDQIEPELEPQQELDSYPDLDISDEPEDVQAEADVEEIEQAIEEEAIDDELATASLDELEQEDDLPEPDVEAAAELDVYPELEISDSEEQVDIDDLGDELDIGVDAEEEQFDEQDIEALMAEPEESAEQIISSSEPQDAFSENDIDSLLSDVDDDLEDKASDLTEEQVNIDQLENADFDELLSELSDESLLAESEEPVSSSGDVELDELEPSFDISPEPEAEDSDQYLDVGNIIDDLDDQQDAEIPEELNIDVGLDDFEELDDVRGAVDVDAESGGYASQLDLARMYLEMDDEENAKVALAEVMSGDNDEAKQQAQDLLAEINKS